MKMNVKESMMVRPTAETPSGNLWLSNLDLQMPATYHSRSVFLYRSNGAANFFDVALLKAALGQALVDFYPYAGRLEKADDGRLQINCNAEGVLFVVAECDAAVDDLGDFGGRAPDLSLVPKVDYSGGITTWPLLLLQGVNGRPRLRPPLPLGLFGNVNFYTTSTALCGELVSNPVGFVAEKVQAAVEQMNDEYLRSVIDYLEVKMPSIINTPAGSENFVGCPNFGITSWVRLPLYEGDFGWGKPAYAGPAVAQYEGKAYLLLDPESEGSWLLQITLLKPHMEAFRKLFYDFPPSTKNMTI